MLNVSFCHISVDSWKVPRSEYLCMFESWGPVWSQFIQGTFDCTRVLSMESFFYSLVVVCHAHIWFRTFESQQHTKQDENMPRRTHEAGSALQLPGMYQTHPHPTMLRSEKQKASIYHWQVRLQEDDWDLVLYNSDKMHFQLGSALTRRCPTRMLMSAVHLGWDQFIENYEDSRQVLPYEQILIVASGQGSRSGHVRSLKISFLYKF